jgi:BlaI family transcriptional regulator, penicillinase repressor
MATLENLSKRERQIMDTLYALGDGGAREIAEAQREPEALDTIRVTLSVLERKGLLRHRTEGRRHLYSPIQPKGEASRSAWRRLTRTFFGGSPGKALLTVLDISGDRLADEDLDRLSRWVAEQTKKRKSQ